MLRIKNQFLTLIPESYENSNLKCFNYLILILIDEQSQAQFLPFLFDRKEFNYNIYYYGPFPNHVNNLKISIFI